MKDLIKLANECMAELDAIGIKYGKVFNWTVNKRAKSRWGYCKCVPGGFDIEVSDKLLADDVPDIHAKTTIHHELLHTVPGGLSHTGTWKVLANRVNAKYGYDIKRTTSAEEKGFESRVVEARPVKHKYKCKSCGQILEYTRECKFTKNHENYRCGICSGDFEQIF